MLVCRLSGASCILLDFFKSHRLLRTQYPAVRTRVMLVFSKLAFRLVCLCVRSLFVCLAHRAAIVGAGARSSGAGANGARASGAGASGAGARAELEQERS
jgi:hypothetical protein